MNKIQSFIFKIGKVCTLFLILWITIPAFGYVPSAHPRLLFSKVEEKEVKKQELNVIDQSLDRIKACFINSLKGADDTRYDRGIIVHNDEKITLNYEQKEPKVTFNVESSQRLAEMYPDIYQKFCTVQKQSPRFSLKKENLKKGERYNHKYA